MARFYFDVANGHGQVPDEDGQDFPSVDHASREVRRILSDLARDELGEQQSFSFTVSVRGGDGTPIYEASLVFTERWMRGPEPD